MALFNKLVRDRIPEIIEAAGLHPIMRTLDTTEYILALRAKMLEEVQELLDASTAAEITAEAADLIEVLAAYCDASDTTMDSVFSERRRKAESRGVFEKRLFLIETK
jgi:predicted house-cleaning noncanonical NTP pyrophosphatase (MazG superfamily)